MWAELARDVQASDPDSTLTLYRGLLAARKAHDLGSGELTWLTDLGEDVIGFRNGGVTVVGNTGSESVALPAGRVIAASGPVADGVLPADTAVWLADD